MSGTKSCDNRIVLQFASPSPPSMTQVAKLVAGAMTDSLELLPVARDLLDDLMTEVRPPFL